MTNKIKNLLETIQKFGEDKDPVPSRSRKKPSSLVPAGSSSGVPGRQVSPAAPGAAAVPNAKSVNEIKEMQKSLQNFAEASVKYNKVPTGMKGGKMTYKIDDNDKRRDFNDFLIEQFGANAEIRGEEFNIDPRASTRDSKLPTDLIQLNIVLDSLQRIGPGSKEALKDGVWDFRTNNAVRNVYAIAVSLVEANQALGGMATNDPRLFTKNDLAALRNAIPKTDPVTDRLSASVVANKAQEIAKLVNKLTAFYNFYSKTILNHPDYKRYTHDTGKPILNLNIQKDPIELSQYQKELLSRKLEPIRVLGLDINVNDLQTQDGLKKIMTKLIGYKENEINNKTMKQTIQMMIDEINRSIADAKSKGGLE